MTFDTRQEAYDFQELVIEEAVRVGATVVKSDITVASPPEYRYRVIMPDKYSEFAYGNKPWNNTTVLALQIGIGVTFSLVLALTTLAVFQEDE